MAVARCEFIYFVDASVEEVSAEAYKILLT